ncbi:hypothetical protein DICVIV_01934 [Dictyocaulus viviparus]|uniref:BED-type domain-containing protein n=1 Tax=Dictyocaulus viviparus TaxID=29172 RepID=A0A0D8Y556_DICVI|nr:hypothetical protein DICVIV_01934 [Dictyocaulus viviparus]
MNVKLITFNVFPQFKSTTGMIRHLRSCHVQEYQQVQEARQSTLILKMDLDIIDREFFSLACTVCRIDDRTHWVTAYRMQYSRPTSSSRPILRCEAFNLNQSTVKAGQALFSFESYQNLNEQMMFVVQEKARAQLLREMNTQVASTMVAHITKKTSPEPQKSPSASSSSSDTNSSGSSLFGPALPPLPPLSIAPAGLPAPKPVKIFTQPMVIKRDATEVEEEMQEPTDLSQKTSAFSVLSQKKCNEEIENDFDQKSRLTSTPRHFQLRNVDERKINAQFFFSSLDPTTLVINRVLLSIVFMYDVSTFHVHSTATEPVPSYLTPISLPHFNYTFLRYRKPSHIIKTHNEPHKEMRMPLYSKKFAYLLAKFSNNTMQKIAMMMLIDQIPSKIVDGHGFRSLMSFLLPEYPMPSAELFESTICPEVITQIQPHLSALFVTNNRELP